MLQALKGFTQPVIATIHLVKLLGVKVCKTTINNTIQNHPDNATILAIADSLQQWHIDNVVLKTSAEKLAEIPTPFIAHTNKNNFVTVTHTSNNNITYNDNMGG